MKRGSLGPMTERIGLCFGGRQSVLQVQRIGSDKYVELFPSLKRCKASLRYSHQSARALTSFNQIADLHARGTVG